MRHGTASLQWARKKDDAGVMCSQHGGACTLQEEVDIAVRHALQEAARRSEGSFRGRSDVAGAAAAAAAEQDSSVHSANDSVRDGMTFRQVRRAASMP